MSYNVLKAGTLSPGVGFHRPDASYHHRITADSPAISAMTDLKKVSAVTIHAGESIDAANDKMKQRGIRSLIVTDLHEDIIGLITATDILGEKPLQYIQANGGKRADISVEDIMTPASKVECFAIKDVSEARVGDIIETLKHDHRQHAMVVDNQGANNQMTVRGIFSLNQIARMMGVNLQNFEVADTLAEIAHVMNK